MKLYCGFEWSEIAKFTNELKIVPKSLNIVTEKQGEKRDKVFANL